MGVIRHLVVVISYTLIVMGAVGFLAASQMRAEGGSKFDQWRLTYEAQRTRVALTQAASKMTTSALRDARTSEARAVLCLEMFSAGKLLPDHQHLVSEVRGLKLENLFGEQYCVASGSMELEADRRWWEHELASIKDELKRLSDEQVSSQKTLAEMERERA